ncbi:MAG: hypothetical protein QOD06_1885 [Candidatus Binatota bacterium]|nr:hypothetical protein [Candidatus Binatota bacterium]
MDDVPVSREVLGEKMASPHDHLGEVIRRRTGEVSWEILDRESRLTVVGVSRIGKRRSETFVDGSG